MANERYHMMKKTTNDPTICEPASSYFPFSCIFGMQHVHDLGVRAGSSSSDASMTVQKLPHCVSSQFEPSALHCWPLQVSF